MQTTTWFIGEPKSWLIVSLKFNKPGGFGLLFYLETPGNTWKRLDNTWEIEWFFAWIHLVSWKLNGFLRFAPFRIACKPSVPKVECLSTLEIECFSATRFETR